MEMLLDSHVGNVSLEQCVLGQLRLLMPKNDFFDS